MLEKVRPESSEQTILLVEGQGAARRNSLKEALTTEGYRVLSARSVMEAMEEAMDFTGGPLPDLILMDLDSSVRDELSRLGSFAAESGWQQIPMVALSENETNDADETLFSFGCDKFVGMPIRDDQLKRVVSRLLNCRTLSANA